MDEESWFGPLAVYMRVTGRPTSNMGVVASSTVMEAHIMKEDGSMARRKAKV